jgi:hypothetical protein
MKIQGSGGIAPHILNLGTRWKKLVSFTNRSLYPGGTDPITHWVRGSVGPKTGVNLAGKRNITAPAGNQIPAVQPVA